MKNINSPRQFLARTRDRKTHYRNALYQQGWRQHTLWTTVDGWREILLAAKVAGPGKVRGGYGRGGGQAGVETEAKGVTYGQQANPAYTSDTEDRA